MAAYVKETSCLIGSVCIIVAYLIGTEGLVIPAMIAVWAINVVCAIGATCAVGAASVKSAARTIVISVISDVSFKGAITR